jgi:hypothetical protein
MVPSVKTLKSRRAPTPQESEGLSKDFLFNEALIVPSTEDVSLLRGRPSQVDGGTQWDSTVPLAEVVDSFSKAEAIVSREG